MAFNNALNNSKRIKEQKKVFRIGDVLWAKISGYPTWPCIVCPDPYTKDFIKEKKNNNVSLHVRFLNDQGKRSWVKNTVLFQGKKALFSAYPKYKFNFQKKKKLFMMWKLAITEAKELLKFNEERRLKQFYTKYSIPDDSESNTSMSHSRKQPIPDQASFSSKRFKKTENKSLDGCVNNTPMTSTSTDPLLYSEIEHESREKSQPTSDRNSENIQQPNAQSSKKVKREKSQQTSDRNSEIIQQPIAESSKKVKRKKLPPCPDNYEENDTEEDRQSDLTRKTQILKKTKSFLSRCKSFRKSLLKEAQYHACVVCTDANNTVKCEGSCNLHFHRHCFAINRQKIKSTTKFKKGSGKRNKRRSSTVKQNMDNLNENLVHEQLVQNDFNNKCSQCTDGKSVCFVCESPIDKKEELVSCKFKNCSNFFHTNCLEEWPQSLWIQDNRVMCPHHNCHFCISDNPLKGRKTHVLTGKLLKCIKCPTSYHRSEYCLTAGSKVLSYFDIICNKHIDTKNTIRHYNTRWCLICAKSGGPLVRCELCPNSFHFECSNDDPSQFENGGFICDECKSGRFPVYGEIVWTKLGTYRWWPAQIMFPEEVPDTVNAKEHSVGEFVVQFFGTLDYCWMNRGQVYLFDEGDQAPTVKNKKKDIDQLFHDAVIEAIEAHKIYISNKNKRDALIANKSSLKPIHYVKIKFNCPFGKLKYKNLKTCKKDAICKCDPNEEDPCSLDSSCINRQMLFECDPKTCPAGQKCKNQDFEKQLGPQLATFLTENKGWGVKTLENIKHGSFIIEYVGDLLNNEEFKKRMNEMQRNHEQNFYFLSLDNSVIIDAGPKGNLSRFMNHSCDPNCEAVKWVVDGESRIGLFALRDIAAGTELVFNYQSRKAKCRDVNKKPCHCGAKNCCEFLEF
ncbi:Zinc finger, PHD-type,Zinc finger, RING-type,PWWP domain,Zinc finger, FYVE/PHD-type,SET [Cinara cedri]|uniref:Zinc finger, PHD-type,Zinc finger, RING-type,PWWP domain,Zinc finger, FYVE/PHD-type,SET n=1 Tax=Cinara cedri TaxID=506608 RepID=A0A5E4MXN7_9HEMI|nr:Zinc finger, PHD-type,Zinc finger, RING-type,PWWP domain,Zinc finger, FYVE/PHD-type,SET [Cinara cedri]